MASFSKINQLSDEKLDTPSINPATDEKTTLIAKPAFVIALKSMYIDLMEMELDILFKVRSL